GAHIVKTAIATTSFSVLAISCCGFRTMKLSRISQKLLRRSAASSGCATQPRRREMADELAPDQQLLLWDLALRGGRALQKDVDYKEIANDRKQLERRRFISVSKQGRSYALELTDGGWNELAKRASILLKSKKKPSRERSIIQLLLNSLQQYAIG